MSHRLEPLFRPRSVAFIGGSNLITALKYQRDLGFAGPTWVVSPKYDTLEGYTCVPSIQDLPDVPDLAFVSIRREAAVKAIAELRDKGCRAVVCNAAGFSEIGSAGADLQAELVEAAGDMVMLGPNAVGLVNFIDPMATIMQHYGTRTVTRGVAIVSQGGGLLVDALYSDRDLAITHGIGGGNQAVTGVEECVDYLLDDPRVTAIGLAFETLRDVNILRRAAVKALKLGKPIVAFKLGTSVAGAKAAASHTASMAGDAAVWEALLNRLGIISTRSETEFLETLKLIDSGHMPKGRRVLVATTSGVHSIMLADHLSAAGFELPQPTGARVESLRELLPVLATPGNPQDVTMGAWNDQGRQSAIYSALLDEGYDAALIVQNYPRAGMEHIEDYAVQGAALADACRGRDIAAIELAPLVEGFPADARARVRGLGLAAMQGLEECMSALTHAVWWQERRGELMAAGLDRLALPVVTASLSGVRQDEPTAKAMLATAGISVPVSRVTSPAKAAEAATEIGYPVAIKAVDARLLHKTEVGAVRLNLESAEAVREAVEAMRLDMLRLAPDVPLTSVLVEAMAADVVVELMASITNDPAIGPVMLLAGGGIEAELWKDSALVAAPFSREEISRALDSLKASARLDGWRGRPSGDRAALLDMLEALCAFALDTGAVEIEINPILVGRTGSVAVDAVLELPEQPKELVVAVSPGSSGVSR